jgi:hypothetical protein
VDGLDSTVGYVALGATALALLALLLCLTMAVRLRRVRNDQRLVLGERREDLVEHAAALARRVDELQDALESEGDAVAVRLEEAERRLDGAITKTSVLRYDAFNETSGRQSSTVALLDDLDNGVVITAILQREQARVYAKPVIGGRSELKLSPEEADAMERARRGEAAGGAADERAAG